MQVRWVLCRNHTPESLRENGFQKGAESRGDKRHTQVAAPETPGDLCRDLDFQICSPGNMRHVTHATNFLYSGTLSENHHRFLWLTWRRVGSVDSFRRAAVLFLEQYRSLIKHLRRCLQAGTCSMQEVCLVCFEDPAACRFQDHSWNVWTRYEHVSASKGANTIPHFLATWWLDPRKT